MLIKKKAKDQYFFFDPNESEYYHQEAYYIAVLMHAALEKYHASEVLFLDARQYFLFVQKKVNSEPEGSHCLV